MSITDARPELKYDARFGVNCWRLAGNDSQYSARNEILDQTQGFDVSAGFILLPWSSDPDYPERNDYPNQFLDLFSSRVGNAEYAAVKNHHARMIMGNGLEFIADPALVSVAPAEANMAVRDAKAMFDASFLPTAAYDLAIFRGFAAQECLEFRTGIPVQETDNMPTHPYKVYGQRVSQVRVGPPRMNEDGVYRPQWYWLAEDWTQVQIQRSMKNGFFVLAKAYAPHAVLAKTATDSDVETLMSAIGMDSEDLAARAQLKLRRLHWDIEYNPAGFYYPLADVECALNELHLCAQATLFQLATLNNGAYAGQLLAIPREISTNADGTLTDKEYQEQQAIAQAWQDQLAGAKNAGQTAILFFDPDKGARPEMIDAPSSDNDTRFLAAQQQARDRILIASGAMVPEIYGIPSKTGFSSKADQLRAGYQLVEASITGPLRKRLIDYVNDVLRRAGLRVTANITYETPLSDNTTQTTSGI